MIQWKENTVHKGHSLEYRACTWQRSKCKVKGRLAVSGNRISDAVSSRVLAKTSPIKTIKPRRKKLLKRLKDRKMLLDQQNKYYKIITLLNYKFNTVCIKISVTLITGMFKIIHNWYGNTEDPKQKKTSKQKEQCCKHCNIWLQTIHRLTETKPAWYWHKINHRWSKSNRISRNKTKQIQPSESWQRYRIHWGKTLFNNWHLKN